MILLSPCARSLSVPRKSEKDPALADIRVRQRSSRGAHCILWGVTPLEHNSRLRATNFNHKKKQCAFLHIGAEGERNGR